jgi:poly-gamma-glutamate synthesis protein (capsule biosynthesis protein)
MDEADRQKYLLENKHARPDDYSPIIHLGQKPETPISKAIEYIDEKADDAIREIEVAVRPRKKLTLKETGVFVSALVLFVMVNGAIFSFIYSFKKEYPSVIAFGDVMLDRGVRNIMERSKKDPFEFIKKDNYILKKYDQALVNLEGPIVEMDRGLCQQKAYNFQFPTNTPDILKSAGISIVNIANNHSYDCYRVGYNTTKNLLEKANLSYVGDMDIDKSYVTKTIDNKKVAFVGIDQTIMPVPVSKFYDLIKTLKTKNDYVVVVIHWGTEYLLRPDENQVAIGHKLIDSGADVIFGSHPHVVEPVEVYKNRIIFYSLGNFVFDQDFGDTTVGLGAGVEFQKNKMLVTLYPFNLNKFRPEFMKEPKNTDYCEKLLDSIANTGCSFEVTTKN